MSSANVQIIAATADQEPILANLLELYAYDFSEFTEVDLNADGKFSCFPDLAAYWREPDHYAFLTRVDGNLAGLVLLKRGSEFSGRAEVWDMDEFFVVRRYRRRGIGTQMAHEVWRRFPGVWEIRVMEENAKAGEFWERAMAKFTGEAISPVRAEKDGQGWKLFWFESKPGE